jgi:hypothetical protein
LTRAPLDRAAEFLWTHGRLLERRLFEHAFGGGDAAALVEALRAYRNADGGFGHALEPDLRTPTSQPLFVDVALAALQEARTSDAVLVEGAAAFLARVARDDGPVPYVLRDAEEHPHADHWTGDFAYAPSLSATAALAGRLHALGARHEWLDRATSWCLAEISGGPRYGAHALLNAMEFLRHAPDRDRSAALWKRATARLLEGDLVALATPVTTYGLTPLRFAPTPHSPAHSLFTDDVIERHLDHLAAQQQEDGGWPIFWTPPVGAAVAEWRGRWTLDALRTLRAYGRI